MVARVMLYVHHIIYLDSTRFPFPRRKKEEGTSPLFFRVVVFLLAFVVLQMLLGIRLSVPVLLGELKEDTIVIKTQSLVKRLEGTSGFLRAKELDQGEALDGAEVGGRAIHVSWDIDILDDTEVLKLVAKLVNRDVTRKISSHESADTEYRLLLDLGSAHSFFLFLLLVLKVQGGVR